MLCELEISILGVHTIPQVHNYLNAHVYIICFLKSENEELEDRMTSMSE